MTTLRSARGGGAVNRLRPFAPYLVITLVAIGAIFGLISSPTPVRSTPQAPYVLIAGAAGLRWDDVNPVDTPTMWRLAGHGAIGALAVKSGHTPTCPDDGWLTLGAGNFAARSPRHDQAGCPPSSVRVSTPDHIGAFLPDQQTVVRENRAMSGGTQPGALPEAVRCTAAVGAGAAVAAARPYGRVDKYAPALPANPGAFLSSCVLSMVDLGTISGTDPAPRRAAARAADATLARVLAARPQDSLIVVAGLSDTDVTSRLHVAIADGPGFRGGWITSSTTERPGYVQLIDLAPTTLAVLHKPAPTKLFAGRPAGRTGDRPADLTAAVSRLADADREAGAQHRVTGRFFGILAGCQLALMVLMIPVIRRAASTGNRMEYGPRPLPRWLRHTVDVTLVAASLSIPAALLTDAVPWWRGDHAGLTFTAVFLVCLGIGTAAALLPPLRRHVLGVVGVVCALAVTVVGVDVLTGARLQLNGVAGYSALEGGRYAGVGTVGLGVFLAGVLLGAGVLAQQFPRRWRPAVVAIVGGVAVVLVGNPYLGADAGGAVALTAGVCLTAALSTGGWLTFARIAWAALAGAAITGGFALLDVSRPAPSRGALGVFIADTRSGTGGLLVHRAGNANIVALLTSPLTLLVLGSAAYLTFVLVQSWGGLKRLFGISPAVKAGLVGVAVASLIAGAVDQAGLNVAGAAAATIIPLATLASVEVLRRRDTRTPLSTPGPGRDRRGDGWGLFTPVRRARPVPETDVAQHAGTAEPAVVAPEGRTTAEPVPAEPAADDLPAPAGAGDDLLSVSPDAEDGLVPVPADTSGDLVPADTSGDLVPAPDLVPTPGDPPETTEGPAGGGNRAAQT